MDLINILIVAGAVVFVLLLWSIAGVRHLNFLKTAISDEWELVDESLRKRHDFIPNLIETVRMYDKNQEELLGGLILNRSKASREYCVCGKKVEYEYDLTQIINRVVDLAVICTDLSRDTNFLELRNEIDSIEKNISERSDTYNSMVRYYNIHRRIFFLRPLAFLFKYKTATTFEFEV